jgi:hypothetical protein
LVEKNKFLDFIAVHIKIKKLRFTAVGASLARCRTSMAVRNRAAAHLHDFNLQGDA